MKNVNLNRQVVNIKIGCEKGQRKRGCLRVKHHPEQRRAIKRIWNESICLDFRVTLQDSPQILWRAIDLEPMGSLNVENRSIEPMMLFMTTQHGQEISEEVKPKTTLSLTLKAIEKVEVSCDSAVPTSVCYGRLRLHLIIPCTHERHCS